MAYFVRGLPQLQKPTSTLGQLNASLQAQQKLRFAEKQQKQQMLLQAANMKLRQEQADKQLQMQQMRLDEQRLKNDEAEGRRLDTSQARNLSEVRRMKGSAELEPWAQPFFEQLLNQRMVDTNNFRDPDVSNIGMALDDVLNFIDTYSINDDYNKQLQAFGSIANDELEQSKQNKTLRDSFQQIDPDTTASRYNNALFLSGGGLARDMQLQIGPLGTASNIVGIPFDSFDDEGAPVYTGQLTPVQASPHYHNAESEYMRTAMNPYFGQSFNEIGQGLQGFLKNTKFDGGNWQEDKAREHIGGILRTPFGVKGREWRMRSLAGNVTNPNNPEPSNGLYFQLQDDPETLAQVTKMVVDYDLYDQNGQPKPLYREFKDEIDAAIQMAEDKITLASNFDNYIQPATPRSGSGGRTQSDIEADNRASMVSSRVPNLDANGAIGSFYMPEFLQSKPINITSDNSENAAAWDAEKQQFYDERFTQLVSGEDPFPENLARVQAQADADSEYPDRQRPPEEVTYRFDRFIVYPDGASEDGTQTLVLKNAQGQEYPISSTSAQEWSDISSRLKREGIDMADLMNDMNQGWWRPDDPQVVALTGRQEAAPTQPAAPQQAASSFPSYPEWKENNPDGSVADWRAAKAAAQ